jgi:hypothetical protein
MFVAHSRRKGKMKKVKKIPESIKISLSEADLKELKKLVKYVNSVISHFGKEPQYNANFHLTTPKHLQDALISCCEYNGFSAHMLLEHEVYTWRLTFSFEEEEKNIWQRLGQRRKNAKN